MERIIMNTVDTVVIGAGHAGLATSRLLTDAGRDHVVLDRGRVGERWRTERWDSLRLLTPNWMTRLPSWHHDSSDPDGFMSVGAFVRYLDRYANSFGSPVVGGTTVHALSHEASGGYRVATDAGTWRARHVVIATGPHGAPRVPAGLDTAAVLTANHYRNPAGLRPGGVLVIGASSSGVQIADELNRAGRDVLLSAGGHTRMPRSYRGMDIFWWLHVTGRLARTIDEVPDRSAARREPSMQLVGHGPDHHGPDLDLATLQARGVRLLGRFDGMDGTRAQFRPDLAENVAASDKRMHRLLDAVDDYVTRTGLTDEVSPAIRPRRLDVPAPTGLVNLSRERIGTVVVAAGYRPDYPWLRLPITDPDGTIRQYQGVTPAPGVYVVGQRFQHRRDSGVIDGARHDARTVVQHLLTGSTSIASREHHEETAA
jgi:putative flavoprotein involved in K+ transport